MSSTKQTKPAQNLQQLLDWVANQFDQSDLYYGHGTDNPWDEAIALVLPILNLPIDADQSYLTRSISSNENQQIAELVKCRIESRLPVAYLTHKAWFAGLEFYVDERVLVPRSPLAELIENQFSPWLSKKRQYHILDMCTGSGCIAIACAHYIPDSIVDAADISVQALEVAAINVEKQGLVKRVNLYPSNLFNDLPTNRYDLIISNPPYVDQQDMANLPVEYQHEPAIGLTGGEDGLLLVDRMLKQAADYLTDDGVLIVEVGNSECHVMEKYPQIPFIWLEFERGGEGVFLLTASELRKYFK